MRRPSILIAARRYDLAWRELVHNPLLSVRQQREAWAHFVRVRAELNRLVGHPEHANTFHEDEGWRNEGR